MDFLQFFLLHLFIFTIIYYRACGHTSQLDMRHRLTTFILKNPPDTKLNDTGSSLTERKDKKSERKKKNDETNGTGNGNHNDTNNAGSNEDDYGDDDDNWTVDVSEEAVKQRAKDLSMGIKCKKKLPL